MWPSVMNKKTGSSAHGTLYLPPRDEIAPMFHGTGGLGRGFGGLLSWRCNTWNNRTTTPRRPIVRLFVQNPLYWVGLRFGVQGFFCTNCLIAMCAADMDVLVDNCVNLVNNGTRAIQNTNWHLDWSVKGLEELAEPRKCKI
jgi:hypothetical protein